MLAKFFVLLKQLFEISCGALLTNWTPSSLHQVFVLFFVGASAAMFLYTLLRSVIPL
jgi:hypothetical protein